MLRSTAGAAALALALAGCGGLAKTDRDRTPVNPTAVLETHLVNEATKDFPAFETTTLRYTRTTMQRTETSVKGTDAFTRLQAGADSETRIERLDRKLAWTLDSKSRQYSECPIKGCGVAAARKPPARKPDDEKGRDLECRLKLGNTAISIEPTGRKRSINGFDTEQYDIRWLVTFRDNVSRKSTSTVSIELWATPATQALNDANALEKAYDRARSRFFGFDPEPEQMVDVPPEVGRMISSYLSPNVSPTDRAVFLAGARKLDKVKGLPILMNVIWSFTGDACSMGKAAKDAADKPLLAFTSEVKSHKTQALHDSLFEPPKDYKRKK